jgi:voltage-gated potassium channel
MTRFQAMTDTLKELVMLYLLLLGLAALGFMILEGHDLPTSLYWAGTTATSTGYGDIVPRTPGGRWLALALMHASVFIVAPLIVVRLIDRLIHDSDAFTHAEQVMMIETLARIEARLDRLEQRDGSAAPGVSRAGPQPDN